MRTKKSIFRKIESELKKSMFGIKGIFEVNGRYGIEFDMGAELKIDLLTDTSKIKKITLYDVSSLFENYHFRGAINQCDFYDFKECNCALKNFIHLVYKVLKEQPK